MNVEKFTHKSREAVQVAHRMAEERAHQEVGVSHLMVALVQQEAGLVKSLLSHLGVDPQVFLSQLEGELGKVAEVSGEDLQRYFSTELSKVFTEAEKRAEEMGDAFVSTEHLFLASMTQEASAVARIGASLGMSEDRIVTSLNNVRGSHKVTDQSPEE